MRVSNLFCAGVMGLGLLTQSALAEVKVSGEIRGAMVNTDMGDDAAEGSKPINFMTEWAKLGFKGSAYDNVDYWVRFDLAKFNAANVTPVEFMYMTWWMTKEMGLMFGQTKIAQGGWERQFFLLEETYKNASYDAPMKSAYKPMAAFIYKFMGTVEFQLFDDNDASNTWTKKENTHPTFAFQWKGNMMNGGLMPLVQFTSWDNSKSSSFALGMRYVMNEIYATAGLVMDTVGAKGMDDSGDAESHETKHMGYHIEGRYNASGFEPFIYFAGGSTEDYGDTDDKEAAGTPFDASGTTMALGVRMRQDKHVTPFLAWIKDDQTAKVGTEEVDSEVTKIKAGLYAKF
ncbi:MAG: porin [Bdellovibrionota bacterium]